MPRKGWATRRQARSTRPGLSTRTIRRHGCSRREKFVANRPVEALADLQNAEALGRNRETVRSGAGLGEDRAVRGAAVGRISQVLGFENAAITAGAAAIEADPTSPAAHYLMADVLRTRPARDGARTSALLQAQIYDRPGKTVIRPQLTESNLALIETEGAVRATVTEFAPFFDSDGVAAEVSGSGGTQDTFGNELAATVLHEGVSIGVGQFHYQTDGFARNNDVNHDIVSVQGRATVAPWLDLFAEYRYRDTESGDRALDFNLSDATAGLGARVEVTGGVMLRGAYTQFLVRDFLLDQRLEPTAVAGFTQSVDQAAGSTIEQAALGADALLLPWLRVGGEVYWRWIDSPRFELGRTRLDPVLAEGEDRLRQSLADRGIRLGSTAYDREMRGWNEGRNDAYNQLLLTGRGQAVQEALTERNQPINEITALLSGSQVQQPNFINPNVATVPTTDVAGIIANNYQQRLAANAQGNQFRNQIAGGLFQLGAGALAGGYV